MKKVKTKVLNYRVIIEPDERTGTNEPGFSAYCPTLGLADGGDTIEETIDNMKSLIKFHVECLVKDGEEIPIDKDEEIIVTTKVEIKSDYPFVFA